MLTRSNLPVLFLATFLLGGAFGMWAYDRFFSPKPTIKTVTEIRTEYVPIKIPVVEKEFIEVTVPKPVFVKDTIIKEITYPINKYTGSERFYSGYIHYEIGVAGELLDYKFRPEFQINTLVPVNTITNTVTKSYYKNGWFVGGGVEVGGEGTIQPFVGVSTVTKKGWKFDYSYKLPTSSHLISAQKRIF